MILNFKSVLSRNFAHFLNFLSSNLRTNNMRFFLNASGRYERSLKFPKRVLFSIDMLTAPKKKRILKQCITWLKKMKWKKVIESYEEFHEARFTSVFYYLQLDKRLVEWNIDPLISRVHFLCPYHSTPQWWWWKDSRIFKVSQIRKLIKYGSEQ